MSFKAYKWPLGALHYPGSPDAYIAHSTTFAFQRASAKWFWLNMTSETLYAKSLPTPWLDIKKKWIWNAHEVFNAQIKIPFKKAVLWGYSVWNVYAMYVSLRRYDFVVKVIIYGHREVINSRTRKNWCHTSQENVIKSWVALHPSFPDSYSVWRIPEQGCTLSGILLQTGPHTVVSLRRRSV